jgi:hypothetical protein
MKIGYIHIVILAFFSLISPDPVLMIISGLLLFYVLRIMWRENEPKHLLVNMVLYWMVIGILLPYGAIFQRPLVELSRYGGTDMVPQATWLGVIALLLIVTGIHIPIRKLAVSSKEVLLSILEKYDGQRLFTGYIIYSFIAAFLSRALLGFAGGQMLMSLVYFKWTFLTFLIIHTLVIPSNTKYVVFFIFFEIIVSFSGFWSDFKDYILVGIGAFFTLSRKVSFKQIFYTIIVGGVLFFVSAVWSFSKGEYRMYLTGGERTQAIVKTNQLENIQKLFEIVQKDFSGESFTSSFTTGSENLIFRVSYVEFLALTLKNVPAFLPHEDGQMLISALEHIFKPRILFPDKKVISESEITSKYTGVKFAGKDEGTSFSLGTVAEAYVDFGYLYMFIPIFFYGLLLGYMYRTLLLKGYNLVWGLCYSAPILQFAWSFPVPTTKYLGWSITWFVGFYIINRYLIKYLDEWLLRKEFRENP